MATLRDISDEIAVKLLLVGDPGSGKTGSLVSLVKDGYRVFILNFEGSAHLAPLRMHLTPEEQERVIVANLRDDLQLQGRQIWPRKPPTAFSNAMALLDKWKVGEADYGSIYDWGPQDVLVVDSLTSMGAAAMWYRLFVNGRKGKNKRPKDWGEAMEMQEQFLELLRAESIKCNVIVISHLTYLGGDSDFSDDEDLDAPKPSSGPVTIDIKRYPSALGKKLPPRIAGFFPTVLQAKIVGQGRNARRVIRTVPEPDVDLKLPAKGVASELPIETALADIFKALKNPGA